MWSWPCQSLVQVLGLWVWKCRNSCFFQQENGVSERKAPKDVLTRPCLLKLISGPIMLYMIAGPDIKLWLEIILLRSSKNFWNSAVGGFMGQDVHTQEFRRRLHCRRKWGSRNSQGHCHCASQGEDCYFHIGFFSQSTQAPKHLNQEF